MHNENLMHAKKKKKGTHTILFFFVPSTVYFLAYKIVNASHLQALAFTNPPIWFVRFFSFLLVCISFCFFFFLSSLFRDQAYKMNWKTIHSAIPFVISISFTLSLPLFLYLSPSISLFPPALSLFLSHFHFTATLRCAVSRYFNDTQAHTMAGWSTINNAKEKPWNSIINFVNEKLLSIWKQKLTSNYN